MRRRAVHVVLAVGVRLVALGPGPDRARERSVLGATAEAWRSRGQWKTLRTTNVIERLNEEFSRRVKTQGALPTDDAAVTLLFSLVASGQIKLRKLDGWRRLAAVIRQRLRPAASSMKRHPRPMKGDVRVLARSRSPRYLAARDAS